MIRITQTVAAAAIAVMGYGAYAQPGGAATTTAAPGASATPAGPAAPPTPAASAAQAAASSAAAGGAMPATPPPPAWKQGMAQEQTQSPLHPFAPHLTGRAADELPLDKLKVPAGFKVEVWTDGVP